MLSILPLVFCRGYIRQRDGSTRAFTLIELSVVLVIIGLLAGGVLVGQSLIATSQIRSQITEFERYNQATNAFRAKYDCLPGDCANITTFLPNIPSYSCGADSPCGNGNGDGAFTEALNGVCCNLTGFPYEVAGEPLQFWSHLSVVGFTKCCVSTAHNYVIGQNFPQDKIDGFGISVGTIQGVNGYIWAITTNTYDEIPNDDDYPLLSAGTGVVTPSQAQAIDLKIDDGLPTTGNVIAIWMYNGDNHIHPLPYRSGQNCITYPSSNTNSYNTTYTQLACDLFLPLQGGR